MQKHRIVIPSYSSNTVKNQKNFQRLVVLKREKKLQKALAMVDTIDALAMKKPNELRRFTTYLLTNKERSIIYRKLKNKQLTEYYYILSELGGMINAAHYETNIKGVEIYFTLVLSNNEKIQQRVQEYIEWFKPIAYDLVSINVEIEREIRDHLLDYEFNGGSNLEIYMRKKNKRYVDVIQLIERNMPHHFIDKSLFQC
jgi:hypothetical protein